ncbi:MAG: hypothetical protein ACI36Y_08135 [Coriobacteriales bacterium]
MRQSWVSWTLVKDNMHRFWPLWLAFAGAWVLGLLLPLATLAPEFSADSAYLFDEAWPAEYVASLLGTAAASVIAVGLVFEYLYSPTAAQCYGALPLKRGSIFASAFISGLLPLVVVELLVFAVLMVLVTLMPYIGVDKCLTWLGLTLSFTFISYSMACFCAQLTGSKAMTSWLFILGNTLIILLEGILRTMAETMMVGVSFLMGNLATIWTSPIGGILYYVLGMHESSPSSSIEPRGLLILAAYVLAAAAMLTAAVLLNKRRSLERAGNTVAYAGVRLAFKYVIGVCAAVAVGFIALWCMLFSGNSNHISNPQAALMTVFMILGGFAGVFFAELALNKSTRVLGKAWRGGLAVTVLCVLFTGGCVYDLLGIKGYVPAASQVERIDVWVSGAVDQVTVTDEQAIEDITAVHGKLLELPDEYLSDQDFSCYTSFTYYLKDGSSVSRYYDVVYRNGEDSTVTKQGQAILDELSEALSRPEVVLDRFEPFMEADFANLDAVLNAGWVDEQGYTTEVHVDYNKSAGFWKALEKDILESGLGAVHLGAFEAEDVYPKNAASLDINGYVDDGSGPSDYRYEYLTVSPQNAPATCAWFEKNYQVKFE